MCTYTHIYVVTLSLSIHCMLHQNDIKNGDSGDDDDDIGGSNGYDNVNNDGYAGIKFKRNENETRALFNAVLITF